MRAKGIHGNFAYNKMSTEDLEKATDELIKEVQARYDKVGALKPEEVSYESVVKALLNL